MNEKEVKPPFLVSYAITTKCNLSCKNCYSEATENGSRDELTNDGSELNWHLPRVDKGSADLPVLIYTWTADKP